MTDLTSTAPVMARPHGLMAFFQKKLAYFWQQQSYLQSYTDFLLSEINPLWSPKVLKAKVLAIIDETADTKTYVLKMPHFWRGFSAGMHLNVAVEINGTWVRRPYSISSSLAQYNAQSTIAITVKKMTNGRVSNALFDHVQVGQYLQVSQAMGEFTLAQSQQQKVLFLAAGSGITPFMAMLKANLHTRHAKNITLMYYCRHQHEVIFAKKLTALSQTYPHFQLVVILTANEGRINTQQLQQHCPDIAERDVFVCGASGFMDSTLPLLKAQGVADKHIFNESFGVSKSLMPIELLNQPTQVLLTQSARTLQGDGQKTILELAEKAGLQPKYGCRNGLCHQCKCTKLSGQVINARDGKPSSLEQEEIQICIAIPQGQVAVCL